MTKLETANATLKSSMILTYSLMALTGREAWPHEAWRRNKYTNTNVGSNEDGDLGYVMGHTRESIGHRSEQTNTIRKTRASGDMFLGLVN